MSAIDENWDFKVDITELENKLFGEYKSEVAHLSKQITKELQEFQTQTLSYSENTARNSDDELKMITEINKQLVHDIKSKVEEYERQLAQYSKFKSEQKMLAEEIKDIHEAFLMAKKLYKKYLKIYFTVELSDGNEGIYLQFFTEEKKESKVNSVYLLRNLKTKQYEVLQITPEQEICKEVQQKLEATNDVPGALCYIRQHFMKSKKGK